MADMSLDLVVVGSAVVDHIHRVTLLPKRDASAFALDRRTQPGGVERNVAVAAAKLGLRVGVIARLGADDDGRLVLDDLRERGVDTTRVSLGDDGDTAYSLIFVDGQGDRIIFTGGQGVRRLTLDEADDEYIGQAQVCFTSAYLPWPLLKRVAAICGGPDGPALAFDLPDALEDLQARGLARESIDEILPAIDLFMAGRAALQSYSGKDTMAAGMDWLLAKGARRAAISDGGRGLTLAGTGNDSAGTHSIPAYQVDVVDTSGAGDVLHAGLVSEWLIAGQPPVEAGRFAAAAAALSCRSWGVLEALPSRAEVEALVLKRQGIRGESRVLKD